MLVDAVYLDLSHIKCFLCGPLQSNELQQNGDNTDDSRL